MTPTQRSLEKLREDGYTCEVVERWNAHTKQRKDLFGIIDILAIRQNEVVGVQTTSASSVSARVKKIADSELTPKIRDAGIKIIVHGWGKRVVGKYKNGTSKMGWVCREVDLS